jgi:hypothetical protein
MLDKQFHCQDCGSLEGYRSRPRNFTEKYILPALFMRPVRCADCFRRTYQWLFLQVRERHGSDVNRHVAA